MKLKCNVVSSLEKVFADEELQAPQFEKVSALRGETISFQVACWCEQSVNLVVEVDSALTGISIRETALAPCEVPAVDPSENPYILRSTPGLYPDPLMPIDGSFKLPANQWRTAWVSIRVADNEQPGCYTITCKASVPAHMDNDSVMASAAVELEVLPVSLPAQKLLHTEWFHADCIFSFYNMECWSDAYWVMLEKYIANFVDHGMNLLLTPLWTPPLDTKVGGERPTVQLLDIEKDDDTYRFDFSRLGRWIDLSLKNGIKYFEMAHPFSQWGAEFCPKIIVRENGQESALFGWHTSSRSDEYVSFLRQLFPQLLAFLDSKGVKDKCFYHVSDEPGLQHLDNYKACAELIRELVDGAPIIDALSSIEFYNKGLVENPIPCNNHIEPFVEAKVDPLWTYYCISQREKVPNRFFNFPSLRNRIMGILMYKYDVYGFLQWGYNFWYSQFSIDQKLDPFKSTDSGRGFASGDAFMVYPGEDGPIDSIRNEVMVEGLQDLRALRELEKRQGRDATLGMIQDGLDYELSMTEYPRSEAWLLQLRESINRKIAELASV